MDVQQQEPASPAPDPKGPVRVGRLIGGIVLCVVGLVLLLGGIGAGVAGTWLAKEDPVVEDRAPGSLEFTAGDGKYVIALGTSENSWSDFESTRTERREKYRVYEEDVNAARCTIDHPVGEDQRVRGDRQGAATTLGSLYATVGTFDGRGGKTTVSCEFDPPTVTKFSDGEELGRREVERVAPVMVHERNGLLTTIGYALLGVGILLGLLGTLQILRATAWRRPR